MIAIKSKYKHYFIWKRFFDILLSFFLIIILLPIFIIISISIKLDSPGPVFFRQLRLGKNRNTFKIYKFRTMINDAANIGSGIYTDTIDPRITTTGQILRKTSLDELPQIINILKGEMSFIGPRPIPLEIYSNYDSFDKRRFGVKPGITGWAQVNGRNTLTWPQKIEKDLFYVDNISFKLDIKILFMTIKTLIMREGIYSGRYRHMVKKN